MNILIKNVKVVDPVSGRDGNCSILIEEGMIRKVMEQPLDMRDDEVQSAPGRKEGDGDKEWQIIDGSGLTAAPGLMDAHVHFRDPGFTYKEDLTTGAAAAARGGFTHVITMANTKPVVDTPETLREIRERAEESIIHIMQASSVTEGLKGEKLVNMEAMSEAGAALFTDDGIPIMDEALLCEAMDRARTLGKAVSLHEEDPAFVPGAGVHQGRVSQLLDYPGASPLAEEVLTARDCAIALHTGARVCIQHISSARSVAIVRAAKAMGADIHAEATPHHFTLTEDAVLKYGTNARMNPPLRTEEDRLAIIEGLKDGTIDMIVTDHAPHSEEEKSRPLPQAPSGIIGLETSLALGIRSLVQPGHLTLMELIRCMSTNPAEFAGIRPVSISEGEEANLVLFAENETWTADSFASKASNSPFTGWELPGKVHMTICRGGIVYKCTK